MGIRELRIRALGLLIGIGLLLGLVLVFGYTASPDPGGWIEGQPKHHTRSGYRNFPPVEEPPAVGAGFYLRRVMDSFLLPDVPAGHRLTEAEAIAGFEGADGANSITWLGHSTFLIRIDGVVILTDPFLTEYASPLWEFGSRRYVPPGISLDRLPPIDLIVLSHNHLDHLDAETVESLRGRARIHVVAPLGLRPFFVDRGYVNVEALDWHESTTHGGVELTALPALHFSGRGVGDKNKTLWCSWSIASPSGSLFFSGDTSYSPRLFEAIGRERGPFDLALVTIGAYQTRGEGPTSHLTPEEALEVAAQVRGDVAVAMHWGTISLSDEPPWEPPARFERAAGEGGFPPERAWVMKIGETRTFPIGSE